MLDLAIRYEEDLQERYRGTLFRPKYRFYHLFSTLDYSLELSPNSDVVQMVSVGGGQVIGFLGAAICRETNTANNLHILNFFERNLTFTQDIFSFANILFKEFGMERIVWDVVVGNPAERFYDRMVENFGGRVVGTFRNEARLYDGTLHDVKYYELYREEALAAFEATGANCDNYREIRYKGWEEMKDE